MPLPRSGAPTSGGSRSAASNQRHHREDPAMSRLPTPPPAITTFVVRFWCEWSGSEPRCRGRIEHVESGRRMDFIGVQELWGFLERFGIGADDVQGSSMQEDSDSNVWR
jgi:hypothetical protein